VAPIWDQAGTGPGPAPTIDWSVPHQARIYDYWLGGSTNGRADREAARRYIADYPGIRDGVQEQRAFMQRAVRYLAGQAGIRQFLDIGTGLPTTPNVHEVAQAAAPGARVVYVDNDPVVLADARGLLDSKDDRTAFLAADLRDTGMLLDAARQMLDFSQPIAILLIGILQLIADDDHPGMIVRRLLDDVPPGSWLAIAQPTADLRTEQMTRATGHLNQRAAVPTILRSLGAISEFFDGTDLLEPGVVQLHHWRPAPGASDLEKVVPAYAGLGRKP
jgi:SAM-dependent methyltransferase